MFTYVTIGISNLLNGPKVSMIQSRGTKVIHLVRKRW